MIKKILPSLKKYKIVCVVSLVLFLIPFFWFKPGEMDLGGDSGRWVFYTPIDALREEGLYSIRQQGIGKIDTQTVTLSTSLVVLFIKGLVQSPNVTIGIFNSIKLVGGFLSIYLIVKTLVREEKKKDFFLELASIFAGLFYIFCPIIIGNFDRALISHNQVFLNPLIFYLLLQYFLSQNKKYLFFTLLLTTLFAYNFSWLSAPTFFAFYPLGLLFIITYILFVKKQPLPVRNLLFGLCIFVGLHMYHLLPTLRMIMNPDNNVNVSIFVSSSQIKDHFFGILSLAKISLNLFPYSSAHYLPWISIVFPAIITVGFILHRRETLLLSLLGIFWLSSFYLVTASITYVGIQLYLLLFKIPGFYMFRNFNGQWAFVFAFFYALLFGVALFFIFSKTKKIYGYIFGAFLGIYFVISGWPYINGEQIHKVLFESRNVKNAIVMDSELIAATEFLKTIPEDTKILTLPFTDASFQVLYGGNNGGYVGISPIPLLSGKKNFSGYFHTVPFSDLLYEFAKNKDYESIKRLLALLNIRYVFYNQDTRVYDEMFPGYPYTYVRDYLPKDQKGYADLIKQLAKDMVFEKATYSIYETDEEEYLPHFYVAKQIKPYEKIEAIFADMQNNDARTIYIPKDVCDKVFSQDGCQEEKKSPPKIFFEKVNPTKYRIKITTAVNPYILVFSEAFNTSWKVFLSNTSDMKRTVKKSYFNGDIEEGIHKEIFFDEKTFETHKLSQIADDRHFRVNAYANGWYIVPSDVGGSGDYELIIEMVEQRAVYIGLGVSLIFFVFFLLWVFRSRKN